MLDFIFEDVSRSDRSIYHIYLYNIYIYINVIKSLVSSFKHWDILIWQVPGHLGCIGFNQWSGSIAKYKIGFQLPYLYTYVFIYWYRQTSLTEKTNLNARCASILIESWRPNSALGARTSAEASIQTRRRGWNFILFWVSSALNQPIFLGRSLT